MAGRPDLPTVSGSHAELVLSGHHYFLAGIVAKSYPGSRAIARQTLGCEGYGLRTSAAAYTAAGAPPGSPLDSRLEGRR
jgi:hypothetical protein